ncbi:GH32 C-terminal domain-containing protein [Gluconobacter albidus]|uniref:GH32 C-terminal domain-containing protein n=1 Tax=Gluconobacter albidus TaxID=318683 RepID=UPI0007864C16|nr:GH32 C-terminal domain-containing protein [Gluconobacter albidus]
MSRTAAQICAERQALLGSGSAWSQSPDGNLPKLLLAMCTPREQLEADIEALADEISPLNSRLLLSDYQTLMGPDPFGRDQGALTTVQMQQLLYTRWVARGGQSIADYVALGQAFGVTLTIEELDQNVFGVAVCGDVFTDGEDIFVWVVTLPEPHPDLERAIYAARQSHTRVVFEYVGRGDLWPRQHIAVSGGRINDVQRMLYMNGVWHLWFLWNADYPAGNGTVWRHFTSSDLIRWTDVGVSIPKYTTPNGDPWTGSTVIDVDNTAGFGTGAVIALVTMAGDAVGGQATARWYSTDAGNTFTFDQIVQINPHAGDASVTDKVFRDPSVQWHAPTRRWVMVLAEIGKISVYTSADLKDWAYQSGLMTPAALGTCECPGLLQLHLYNQDGTTTQDKWVLYCGANGTSTGFTTGTHYWVGEFDGVTFTPDAADGTWLDAGSDFYAAAFTTDSSAADPLERALGLAWMNNWAYPDALAGGGCNGQLSVPRILQLRVGPGGYPMLFNAPVANQSTVYLGTTVYPGQVISDDTPFDFRTHRADFCRIDLTINQVGESWPTDGVYLSVRDIGNQYLQLALRPGDQGGYLRRDQAGPPAANTDAWLQWRRFGLDFSRKSLSVSVVVDTKSIECFLNNGEISVSSLHTAPMAARDLALTCFGGSVEIVNCTLRSRG